MSKIADQIHSFLKEVFPRYNIIKEHYVQFEDTRLFFDFYVKEFGIFIEVQGRQHECYVHHFHGCVENFRGQKKRDNLKLQYVQENTKFCLVRFYYDEEVTKELVKNKIYKALDGGFYE